MNSSTNPPVKQTQRYAFDLDFEEERLRLEELRQEELLRQAQKSEQEAIAAPTYSEEQMEQVRQAAFQSGYDQGSSDVKNSIDKQVGDLAERMVVKLRSLVDDEEKRIREAQQIALRMSMASVKKIWPKFIEKMGIEIVEDTIRQALEMNGQETRIVVRVHDAILDSVVKSLPQLQDQQAFAGKIIVLADESVAVGDCKVEWADGGLERLSRTLSQQLDHALDHLLATMSSANERNEDERTSS